MSSNGWVVVGGDTTPAASAALRWAVREAVRRGTNVVVVHAFDVVGRADLALERDLGRCRRDARYRAQSWVVEVVSTADAEVPVMVQTPDASVEDALAAAAERAALVVIGEPHEGRHRDLPRRLAARCSCPVVTIGAGREPALAG